MAFLLVLLIVAFWTASGWALLQATGQHRNLLRALLLAPSIGMAALVLLLFELYRLGLPLRLAAPLATASIALALALWWLRSKRRALPPIPLAARVALALAAGAAFAGAPLLTESLAWVSFCNDDMANYVLSARGLVDRGYLAPFPPNAYLRNGDPSLQLTTVLEVAGLRCGAELLLAWLMALTGLLDHRVFMPVIIALQVALAGAGAALVCSGRHHRRQAWSVLLYTPFIPLVVLGSIYQLIAQVQGLTLLTAAAVVLLNPRQQNRPTALLGGALASALGVAYPEVIPFLGLAVLLFYRASLLLAWRWFGAVIAIALLFWNTFATAIFHYIYLQVSIGAKGSESLQFPYYLIPSGLPTFWGFMPVGGRLDGIAMDLAIAAAAALMAIAAFAIARQFLRREPVGAVALSFALILVLLFSRNVDFGTYKAAMYLWPSLAGALALSAWQWLAFPRIRLLSLCLAAAALLAIPTSWTYIAASAGWSSRGSGFVEIPRATESRLLAHLDRLATQPRQPIILADSHNVVLVKFAGVFLTGDAFRNPSKNFFSTSGRYLQERSTNWYAEWRRPGYEQSFARLLQLREARFRDQLFPMPHGDSNRFQAEQADGDAPGSFTLLRSGPALTVLNRSHPSPDAPLTLVPAAAVQNHLILIESSLGANYYLAREARREGRVALFQLEPDYFRPGQTLSSAGRHLLLEVLHPVPGSHMRVELTASLNNDGENRVPPLTVLAGTTTPLGAVGRGSARLQAPVEPLTLGHQSLLLLDMGLAPRAFPEQRTGLMAWFGRNIPLDNRKITSFVRDISLLTAAPEAPSLLENLPADLANPALLYSGAYEDGWVAEQSLFRLRQPAGESTLLLRVNVPDVPTRPTTLTVQIDNEPPAALPLRLGRQDLRLPVPAASAPTPRRIHLLFDRATPLSPHDRRPASALLETLGFAKPQAAPPTPPPAPNQRDIPLSTASLGANWHPFEEFGGAQFRWVDRNAELFLPATRAGQGQLTLELEAGPGVASKAFRLLATDDAGHTITLACHGGRDRYPIQLPVQPGRNRFRLSVQGGGLPTPNDPRILNFRVFGLAWTAPAVP